ncbi:SubName: Full=Related to putative ATP/GTP binding protein-Streptomyces clavuligerus {ECO:0000313/EMBL:CCA77073.1}; Flags: Fragment [Serendipita indica DSM 11827]|nr:SubName: Full=Related to putative ATP/GTP binding protein-Streptomyces clavuligerus {ECO:0000313/EMBL:CCA77073.1}; Flags: Fragment [Serendipita indica DSM 11827]
MAENRIASSKIRVAAGASSVSKEASGSLIHLRVTAPSPIPPPLRIITAHTSNLIDNLGENPFFRLQLYHILLCIRHITYNLAETINTTDFEDMTCSDEQHKQIIKIRMTLSGIQSVMLDIKRAQSKTISFKQFQTTIYNLFDGLRSQELAGAEAVNQSAELFEALKVSDWIEIAALHERKYRLSDTSLGPGFPSITSTYTPRVEAEQQLNEAAFRNDRPTGKNVIVVSGSPGSGKTQLVLHFVQQNRKKFVAAYFIDSSSDKLVRDGFKKYIQPPGITDPQEGLRYLERSQAPGKGPCLIIFDNLASSVDINPYLSTSDHFLVLITTQAQLYLSPRATVYLGEMTPFTPASTDTLKRIGDALGNQPAAITCATAYMNASGTPPDTYLSRLQPELIAERTRSGDFHTPMYAALTVSYNTISEGAQQLLLLLSCFVPVRFPLLQLVNQAASTDFDYKMYPMVRRSEEKTRGTVSLLQQIFCAKGSFDEEGLRREYQGLKQYNFISDAKAGDLVLTSLHPEVKSWVRSWINKPTEEAYQAAATQLLGCSPKHKDPMDQYLNPQIMELESSFDTLRTNDKASFARVLYRTGDHGKSLQLFRQVIEDLQRDLGQNHEDTLEALVELANVEHANKNYADAKTHREAIRKWRRGRLGPDHPKTLEAEGLLAETCTSLGENAEAVNLYRRILEVRRGILGDDDTLTLMTRAKLADVYHASGNKHEALALRSDVYIRRENALGPNDADTILAASNLAVSCYSLATSKSRGNVAEESEIGELLSQAEKLQVQVLQYRKTALGVLDPETQLAMGNLMWTYYELDKRTEAEEVAQILYDATKSLYGSNHTSTRRAELALALFRRDLSSARAIRRGLNENHPDYEHAVNVVETIKANRSFFRRFLDFML